MIYVLLLLFILILIGAKVMGDVSKLNASVAKLGGDVDTLLASSASDQPAIDAAQVAVDAVDAKVVAATPAPAPPAA